MAFLAQAVFRWLKLIIQAALAQRQLKFADRAFAT